MRLVSISPNKIINSIVRFFFLFNRIIKSAIIAISVKLYTITYSHVFTYILGKLRIEILGTF